MIYIHLASFYDALDHANRKRNRAPAIYNEARVNEAPIPVVNHTSVERAENLDDESHAEEELAFQSDEEIFEEQEMDIQQELSIGHERSIDQMLSIEQELDIELGIFEQNDIKPVFETVALANADVSALDYYLFSVDSSIRSNENIENEDSSLAATSVSLESIHNEDAVSSTTSLTTHKVDDDFEYSYSSESDFQPISVKAGYQIKANDSLSNNWPFKENVMKTVNNILKNFMYFNSNQYNVMNFQGRW